MIRKRLAALLLALCLAVGLLPAVPAAAASLPFEDVAAGAWYYADVERAYGSGLFKGVSDTRFDPNGTLSLAQTVTLAARVAQLLEKGEVTLQNGSEVWYSTYVDYAQRRMIMGGEYEGRWNEAASRYEMVEIFAAIPGIDTTVINDVEDNAIPDVRDWDWYAESVYAFYRAGILTGSDGNRFLGDTSIARREVAAILSRLLYPEMRKTLTLGKNPLLDPDAPLTEENLLAMLDAFDPDGAWIIRHAEGTGTSWRDWVFGCSTIGDLPGRLGTAVHEQLHGYTSSAGWKQEYIYVGGGESVLVPFTTVFDTAEMAALIPEELRSFRYDTYVGEEASPIMASRQFGVYGLLDEYTAYCWGMNNDTIMAACFGDNPYSINNTFVAYAEFRYYILRYMLYAKENHPEVYRGILDNEAFRKAFSATEDRFAGLAADYIKLRSHFAGSSYMQEYDALIQAASAPEYQEMLKLLRP